MKTLQSSLALALLAAPLCAAGNDLLAIRVGRAETISKGALEHAVILVENGKIVAIGEDLPVERGIPVLDRPDWVVLPGLVNCYSRMGCDSEGGDDNSPDVRAIDELYPKAKEFEEIVEHGVTTLGLYPAGNGIPGLAVVVRPRGEKPADMVLKDAPYVKIVLQATASSKKRVTDGFKKADEHAEKVKKAKEKWDKDQEKKKPSGSKKEEEKPEEKKPSQAEEPKEPKEPEAKKGSEAFVAPEPDAKTRVFVDLRAGTLRALVSISGAAEFLHWIDALGKESIGWDLRLVLSRDTDLFYVFDKKTYGLDVDGIGDRKLRVVIEPQLTLTPGTMRVRNVARELHAAGAKLVFIPRNDDLANHELWLKHVGELVGAGLDRQVALRGLTLEPAELLGVAERVGSLEKGKDANLVLLDGDPFEPSTRIQAVMLEGRFVHGEVKP